MSKQNYNDQNQGPIESVAIEQDQRTYFKERFNYIPISSELIDHVRRLDTLNYEELNKLKDLITQIGQTIDSTFTLRDIEKEQDKELDTSEALIKKFLIDTLKIHQILALVDVNFAQLFNLKIKEQNQNRDYEQTKYPKNKDQKTPVKELLDSEIKIVQAFMNLYKEISEQLNLHNGLNYVPREENPDGRMFEHASEAATLLNFLVNLKQRTAGQENPDMNQTMNSDILYTEHGSNSSNNKNLNASVNIYQKMNISSQMRTNRQTEVKKVFKYVQDPATVKHDEIQQYKTEEEKKYFDSALGNFFVKLIDENSENLMSEKLSQKLNIKNENLQVIIEISGECLELQSNAKGKADLYFHSYFWCELLKKLEDIQDGIACKPMIKNVKDVHYDSATDCEGKVSTDIYTQDIVVVTDSEDQLTGQISPHESLVTGDKKQKGKKGPQEDLKSTKFSQEKDQEKEQDTMKGSAKRGVSQSPTRGKAIKARPQTFKTIETAPLMEISQKISISQSGWVSTMQGLAATMQKVIINIKKFPFSTDHYNKYIQKFASEGMKYSNKKNKYMEEIQRALFVAQISNDKDSLYLLEKLLIQLMGFCDITIRDQAVVLLNMLYDQLDWQLQEAFRPVIRTVGQHFIVQATVQRTKSMQAFPNLYLGLAAPSPLQGITENYITWHKIEQRNIVAFDRISLNITINFGKFWKTGFFDWRIVEISPQGRFVPCEIIGKPQPVFPIVNKMNAENDDYYDQHYEDADENQGSATGLAQGRFIIHARGIREHTFHEVQTDFQNAQFDKTKKFFEKRGSFYEVEKALDDYAREGVTCLYLMGTLERDNYPILNKYSDRIEYRKDDCSPLAVTSRDSANQMLGGDEGLKRVVQKAKQKGIKVIVDSLARISSSRHHRKYKGLLLHFLNEDGRREICYGTDGQAQKFEDSAMLNYRKVESWDLIIEEVITYAKKMKFDGIHLDNGQAWPQILEPDLEELKRVDVDGVQAYSAEEFMSGEVVLRNENYGYWNTNNMETYANPFFIKLARRLWEFKPNFMILGECYGGFMFENRQIIMARSAIIPRLYRLPVALSQLFGKSMNKDGSFNEQKKENIIVVKKWFNETKRFLPEGTILLQSSTSHSLPYPAYLYGKGTWAAIDTLFFMPDIPITFMGEVNGDVYNPSQQTIFQSQQQDLQIEATDPVNQSLKRVNSAIMQALTGGNDADTTNTSSTQTKKSGTPPTRQEEKRGIPKISSRTNFQDLDQSQPVAKKEQEFKQKLDPRLGYDLSKIKSHYLHRRRLRKEKMVLRYGELFFLTARNQETWVDEVLAYARYSLMETVMIATNFSDKNQIFQIDMEAIIPTFKQAYANNTVVMVRDCLDESVEPTYYFLRQFLEMRQFQELRPYHSLLISLQIVDDDQYIFKKCLSSSIDRLKKNLISGDAIEAEQISILFSDCIEYTHDDIHRFSNIIGSIQTSFLDKINLPFDKMYKFNRKLCRSSELSARLFAMAQFLLKNERGDNFCPAIRAAKAINACNNMGSIVFSTPELGRWSTVGGLGVMVDELSIGLVELGQDVTVITPYYDRNRKGQTGYLAQDPAGFKQVDSITVTVNNQRVSLAVHEGLVRGVKLVFLHNGDCFPAPYVSNGAGHVVFQLAVFNKAILEYCCRKQFVPSIVVSNDWFTGLSAGYVKNGDFGTYFKDSKFLHICHNLQESYEGRIHTGQDQNGIHGLPRQWFSDNGNMINPSKCALINCDQWATVSKSYKEELLQGSSLGYLLKQKPLPFAFPNGIPIKDRLKALDAAAPDHLSAKRKLQMKYFNFGELDDTIPVFSFVGRVTSQKGVHLICDVAENIIQKYNYKVQFLVGGPANMGEGYSAQCAHKMWNLKNKYPNCFWAKPDDFFTDGSLVNRGSDFGLMPSAFEPGGIVQHEFFVGKTPVIAFKTGGLKDSVIEYLWDSEEGSGFIFSNYNHNEFIAAIERAINTYRNKEKYLKLRENAFRATMEGEVVCKAWLAEFCRLSEKNSVDQKALQNSLMSLQNSIWSTQDFKPVSLIQEIFGNEQKQKQFCDIDQGANEKLGQHLDEEENLQDQDINNQQNWKFGHDLVELQAMVSDFDRASKQKKPRVFMLHNRGPRYQKVQLCGSMDEWKVRHEMQFDTITKQWFVNMHLKPGETYLYKYVVNNQHWVVNDEEPQRKDNLGNVNNLCVVDDVNLF